MQQHSDGEHVVARPGGPAVLAALGRQVGGRAQRRADAAREAIRQGAADGVHDPGVRHQHPSLGEQHVLGPQVAVGDAAAMRMRQGEEHVAQDLDDAAQRHLAVVREPGTQRGALDEASRVIDERAGTAAPPGRHELRVSQAVPQQQHLALEQRRVDGERELRRQHLHQQLGIVRRPHGHEQTAVTDGADLALDSIDRAEGLLERGAQLGHAHRPLGHPSQVGVAHERHPPAVR